MKISHSILALLLLLAKPTIACDPDLDSTYFWFDLGNVLVETRNGFDKLDYMPGALEYVKEIKARGGKVGLITNIPETWGEPGNRESKVAKLDEVLKQGWIGQQPFDITLFDFVLVPLYTAEAKPKPVLFEKALTQAGLENCTPFFQCEDLREVDASLSAGMNAHLVEYDEQSRPKFFPLD